jgi:hypothetical protein
MDLPASDAAHSSVVAARREAAFPRRPALMPRGAPDRGITAARAAAAEIVGPWYAKLASDSLVLSVYGHTEAEREAATGYLRGQEQSADEWSDEGPLWHGWALYEAFMAGIDYSRREENNYEPQQNDEHSEFTAPGAQPAGSRPDGVSAQGREPGSGGGASARTGTRGGPAGRREAV